MTGHRCRDADGDPSGIAVGGRRGGGRTARATAGRRARLLWVMPDLAALRMISGGICWFV
jgi:hypothetical protein